MDQHIKLYVIHKCLKAVLKRVYSIVILGNLVSLSLKYSSFFK